MPRLSITILSKQGPRALETTMVSVLENRPADCEIVVALGHTYDDPYHLDGEVRFLGGDAAACGLSARNAALAECRGDVIHLLESGTQVSDGWADAALAHFDRDAHIGSVAPLALDDCGQKVVSAGIEYSLGGKRKSRLATMTLSRICESHARPELVLGPSSAAGFYRRAALLAACESLGCVATDATADVDVALSLAAMGYLAVLEPRCVVYGVESRAKTQATLAAGRAAETVFWRHAASAGWCLSLVAHAALLAGEAVATIARPALAKRLLGRLAGVCGLIGHLGHVDRLVQRHRPADEVSSTGPSVLSIDSTKHSPTIDARPTAAQPIAKRRVA